MGNGGIGIDFEGFHVGKFEWKVKKIEDSNDLSILLTLNLQISTPTPTNL